MCIIDVLITWISYYRYAITKSLNWISVIGHPHDCAKYVTNGVQGTNHNQNFVTIIARIASNQQSKQTDNNKKRKNKKQTFTQYLGLGHLW